MSNFNTVTRDGWNVGCSYPRYDAQNKVLPGVTLSIFKIRKNRIFQYGEGNNRVFDSTDAAYAWALEHGFLMPFVHGFCRVHRVRHTFCGKRTGICFEALRVGQEVLLATGDLRDHL